LIVQNGVPQYRFTPTRVGNSAPPQIVSSVPSVHPHTRGEFFRYRIRHRVNYGSPPHAWGILELAADGGLDRRFTPTRVGNSILSDMVLYYSTVHPHTRGEFFSQFNNFFFSSGSPPHAWGILQVLTVTDPVQRFTPTRVGNSSLIKKQGSSIPVHPHTRGEF